MVVKTEINALLNKKMDRKDFLKSIAIGLVAVTGVSAALRSFAPVPAKERQTAAAPQSYGGSAYGGTKLS